MQTPTESKDLFFSGLKCENVCRGPGQGALGSGIRYSRITGPGTTLAVRPLFWSHRIFSIYIYIYSFLVGQIGTRSFFIPVCCCSVLWSCCQSKFTQQVSVLLFDWRVWHAACQTRYALKRYMDFHWNIICNLKQVSRIFIIHCIELHTKQFFYIETYTKGECFTSWVSSVTQWRSLTGTFESTK